MLPFSKKYFRLLYFHEISLYIVETCLYKCLGNCPPPPKKRGGAIYFIINIHTYIKKFDENKEA